MLILTSNGLSSNILIEKVKAVLNSAEKAVIVTTASEYKDRDRHIVNRKDELRLLGLSVDLFDFDVQPAEELLNYDVILINGGNPFYLLNSMKKSNCESIMAEFAQNRIIIGASAGAVVLQKNIKLIAKYSPEMNDGVGLADLRGLSLTDIEILPHYSRYIDLFNNFEQTAVDYEKENNCRVVRINDGEAVFDYGNGFEKV